MTSLRVTTDLHRVEALVAALASKFQCTRAQAAGMIRNIDSQRRREQNKDNTISPRAVVGVERRREIHAVLKQYGWSIRACVDQKLPLLKLPLEVRDAVRQGRLEPSKALILGRIRNQAERKALLEECLAGKHSVRGLKRSKTDSPDGVLGEDLKMLERHATRELGTRVRITKNEICISFGDLDEIMPLLEQLGVRGF
jgi:ParB family transcriptional regulator, chromosome partitioning protein